MAAAESKVPAGWLAVPAVAKVFLADLEKTYLVPCVHCVDAPPVQTTAHLMTLEMSQGPASTMLWESCLGRLPAPGAVSWAVM